MECFSYLRNIQDLLSVGKHPIRETFWRTFQRSDHSVSFTNWVSLHICEGSIKNPPIWKESLIWIVHRIRSVRGENLEGWRNDGKHWGVGNEGRIWNLIEKTQCKRGDISQRERRIHFSAADGRIELSGRDQELRRSILIREHPIRGRGRMDFLAESEGSLQPPQDSYPDAGEAINDFWSMSGNFIFSPSPWSKSQTLLAERRIIPYSAEIHWRISVFEMMIFRKWDGILVSLTKIPSDGILEGLFKLRSWSEKLKTVNRAWLDLIITDWKQRWKEGSSKKDIRKNNFEVRNGNYERNAVGKNQGTKQRVQRILGDCWQWKANGQCTKGDTCSLRHDINKRAKSTQPNLSPSSSTQQNERDASRTRSSRGRSPSGRTPRWPCKDYVKGTCTNSFCEINWHGLECLF